jgi:hypothetical protein
MLEFPHNTGLVVLDFHSRHRHLFCVCDLLCVVSVVCDWLILLPVLGVLPSVYINTNLKKLAMAEQRAVELLIN